MADNEIDHIEELEKRLYARDPEAVPERKYGILHPRRQNVESTWGDTSLEHAKQKTPSSLKGYRRFFLITVLFFVIALGLAFFSIYRAGTTLSSKNVDIAILGNSFVGAGEELPLQVSVTNTNSVSLDNAVLTLIYPKGAVDSAGGELVRDEHAVGSIGSGKTISQNFTAILYGEQGTGHTITAHLEYKLAGSNAVFIKEKTFSVIVNASPITLNVDGPAAVANNQPFTLTIRTLFNGDKPLTGSIIRVEYPSGYVFQSAIPSPVSGNNVWNLGDLVKGTEQVIQIKGKLLGEQGDAKAVRVYVGTPESSTNMQVAVAYNSTLHTVAIERPFISGDIVIGNNDKDADIAAVPFGSAISGNVSWINNAALPVSNAKFTLSIDNTEVDMNSVVADNAIVDTLGRTITWNSQSNSSLTTIAAGGNGTLPFTFSLLPTAINPGDINLTLSVEGVFPDRDYAQASIAGIDQKIVRFASQIQFASNALYSIGGIANTGPFPPKANAETTYTVQWTMLPVQNPLSSAIATATLPEGVKWVGTIMPKSEALTYNDDTRKITWNIGAMPKSNGTLGSRTVAFQVAITPTKNQIGSEIGLLSETTITANDASANVPLSVTRPALTTRVVTDPAYEPGKEKVVQ
jgi:hypothetical protein